MAKAQKGTPAMRNQGGYVPGGRPQPNYGDGNVGRMVDRPGPNDPVEQNKANYDTKSKAGLRMKVEPFKSEENQKNTSMAGVRDTASYEIEQLRRSTPAAGVYQSGNNERGGTVTRVYDSDTDADLNIHWSQLDELRAHQDAVGKSGGRGGKGEGSPSGSDTEDD